MGALSGIIRGMSIVQRCNTMLAPRLQPLPPLPLLAPVESNRAGSLSLALPPLPPLPSVDTREPAGQPTWRAGI